MPETMPETMQDIENMTDKEKMNLLLRMVIDMRKNNVVTEEVIDRKLEQKCSEIKKDFECKFVRMKADIDNAVQAERDKENNVIIRNLPESRSENVMNKVHKLLRDGLRLNLSVAAAERKHAFKGGNGLVIVTLKSKDEKQRLMDCKSKLQTSKIYNRVFIDHDKSKQKRDNEANLRAIVKAVGNNQLQVRGSRILASSRVGNRQPTDRGHQGRPRQSHQSEKDYQPDPVERSHQHRNVHRDLSQHHGRSPHREQSLHRRISPLQGRSLQSNRVGYDQSPHRGRRSPRGLNEWSTVRGNGRPQLSSRSQTPIHSSQVPSSSGLQSHRRSSTCESVSPQAPLRIPSPQNLKYSGKGKSLPNKSTRKGRKNRG